MLSHSDCMPDPSLPPRIWHRYNLPCPTTLVPKHDEDFVDSLISSFNLAQDYLVKKADCRLAALTMKRVMDSVVVNIEILEQDSRWEKLKEDIQDIWTQIVQVYWMVRPLTHAHVLLLKCWLDGWKNISVNHVNLWEKHSLNNLVPQDSDWLDMQALDREDDDGQKAIEKWLQLVEIASSSGDESVLSEDTVESDDEEGFNMARQLVGALQSALQELLMVPVSDDTPDYISGSLTYDSHSISTKLQFVRAMHQLAEADFTTLIPSFFGGLDAVTKEENDAYAKWAWEKNRLKKNGKPKTPPSPTYKAGEGGQVGYTVYRVQEFLESLQVLTDAEWNGTKAQLDLETDPIASYGDVPTTQWIAQQIKRIEICWIDGDEGNDPALGHIEVLCF